MSLFRLYDIGVALSMANIKDQSMFQTLKCQNQTIKKAIFKHWI